MVFSCAKAGPSNMVDVGAVSTVLSLQMLVLEQLSHQGDLGAQGGRGLLKFQIAAVQRFNICTIKALGAKRLFSRSRLNGKDKRVSRNRVGVDSTVMAGEEHSYCTSWSYRGTIKCPQGLCEETIPQVWNCRRENSYADLSVLLGPLSIPKLKYISDSLSCSLAPAQASATNLSSHPQQQVSRHSTPRAHLNVPLKPKSHGWIFTPLLQAGKGLGRISRHFTGLAGEPTSLIQW